MRVFSISLAAMAIFSLMAFTKGKILSVTSSAFTSNGKIPVKYSCQGQEASPPLTIGNIPSGTQSLAIILHDPDAPMKGGFSHWVVWNIAVNGDIPENFTGGEMGLNSAKKMGYVGMCPPSGTHHYHFMVYALDTKLTTNKNTDKAALEKAMKGHVLASGDLVGLFNKDYK